MTFKKFVKWCNDRSCDGRWGVVEAMICRKVYREVNSFPFWKRNKVWKNRYCDNIYKHIVEPTNATIEKHK